jgi:succinate dehydrogenase / fumarate reductase cytochrome b subunit
MYKTTGFFSFALRRITGIALVLYLFTHIWVIGSAVGGAETFDARLNVVQSPFFKILEIGLLAAVFYHAFDGLRLLLVNWFKITDRRKSMFWAAIVLTALMVLAGGIPILLEVLKVMG